MLRGNVAVWCAPFGLRIVSVMSGGGGCPIGILSLGSFHGFVRYFVAIIVTRCLDQGKGDSRGCLMRLGQAQP
jgi:hypothetical protein